MVLSLEYSVCEKINYAGSSLNGNAWIAVALCARVRGKIYLWLHGSHLFQTVKLLIAMSIFRKLTVEFSFAKAKLKLKGYNSIDASPVQLIEYPWYSVPSWIESIHPSIYIRKPSDNISIIVGAHLALTPTMPQIILSNVRLAKQ